MVDIMDAYKSLNIGVAIVIKNPEMLNIAPDHLKTKKMCNHAVKILPYLSKYVHDQYKSQQMYDKATLENSGILKFVPYCYKNQEMCNKAVENYLFTTKFVSELKKCVIKKLIDAFLYFILFLINIKLKKCVILLFLKTLL